MRNVVWATIASISVFAGYVVAAPIAVPITASSRELVSIGAAFGTLTALVYRNYAELTKRLDRLERRVDSLPHHGVQEVRS